MWRIGACRYGGEQAASKTRRALASQPNRHGGREARRGGGGGRGGGDDDPPRAAMIAGEDGRGAPRSSHDLQPDQSRAAAGRRPPLGRTPQDYGDRNAKIIT